MKICIKNNTIKNIVFFFLISSHSTLALEEIPMLYEKEEVISEKISEEISSEEISNEAPKSSEVPKEEEENELSSSNNKVQHVPLKKSKVFIPWKTSSPTIKSSEVREAGMVDSAKEERFEEIRERANKTSALGSAMGAIDLGSTPANKIRVGAGVGNTSESQAVAVGIGYAPTENLRVNTKLSTTTDSTYDTGISIGASYDLDLW